MERPSYPCKFVHRGEKNQQSRRNIEQLLAFADKEVNDLFYIAGIIIEMKWSKLSNIEKCLSLLIRDCSIDPNCANYNCLGDANLKGVRRLLATDTYNGVSVYVEKNESAIETHFSTAMFAEDELAPKRGDVVVLLAKVSNIN